MTTNNSREKLPRRKFIVQGAVAAGAVALAGTGIAVSRRFSGTPIGNASAPQELSSIPSHQIDPQWPHYEEVARFPAPRGKARRLSIGAEDRLYVAAGKHVCVADPTRTTILEIALGSDARCVTAVDNLIYVGLRDHVEIFNAQGQQKATWDAAPGRPWFTGLAVGKNDLFAADAGNRVILRYDRSGKLLGRIGEKDSARQIPGFIVPSPFFDVALGPDGLLRVTNPGRHQVEAYTFDGDLELSWGKVSAALDDFCGCCNPISLRLLPDGRCITCEKGLPRVKLYTAQGKLEAVVAVPSSFPENALAGRNGDMGALDAAVDSSGRIFILDSVRNDIRVMQRKGATV